MRSIECLVSVVVFVACGSRAMLSVFECCQYAYHTLQTVWRPKGCCQTVSRRETSELRLWFEHVLTFSKLLMAGIEVLDHRLVEFPSRLKILGFGRAVDLATEITNLNAVFRPISRILC